LAATGFGEASDREAAKFLFDQLQRASIHYSAPCEPFGGGLLSAGELSHIVGDIGAELQRNREGCADFLVPKLEGHCASTECNGLPMR